jgi:hypothetical protein
MMIQGMSLKRIVSEASPAAVAEYEAELLYVLVPGFEADVTFLTPGIGDLSSLR